MRVRFECVDEVGITLWSLDVPQVYMVAWSDNYKGIGAPAFFGDTEDGVVLVQEEEGTLIDLSEWVPDDGAIVTIGDSEVIGED